MAHIIFTAPDIIAHFAALHGVLEKLDSKEALESGGYSLDHMDAIGAMLCSASMANKVRTGCEDMRTFTEFTQFLANCLHVATAMGLDLPNDKCIHELTAYLFCEIMGVDDEGPDHAQGRTIN